MSLSCYIYRRAKAYIRCITATKTTTYSGPKIEDILINFVLTSISKGYINIIVVIDRLSKIRHLIAALIY